MPREMEVRRAAPLTSPKRHVAPRAPRVRWKNAPLVCLYLMTDLLDQMLRKNGGDWDAVLSEVRALRGEPLSQRQDAVPGGYAGMARFIAEKVREWGAH